ncbi:MAG: cupin domain-containing protein [Sphaerochaeta sp.]|jgi:quercetin dioxygenase-like cupin family protein|uniref:cupin domain-containing protein n=1 Tax=Sphaerochaeta sp. TaxID=1972642 RepID=UPI002FCB20A9
MEQVLFAKDAVMQQVGDGVSRKILAYNENIMPVEVHFEKGGVGSIHSHVHTQVTYVLEGAFEFTIDGKPVVVRKGDTLVFASNVKHGTTCLEKGAVLDVFTPYREDFVQ